MKFEPKKWVESIFKAPKAQTLVEVTAKGREASDFSGGLSPSTVASMIEAANGGDIKDQCRLAIELEEKNWTVAQAMNTRRNAVTGTPWHIVPADESDRAQKIADALEIELKNAGNGVLLDNFQDLIFDLSMASLPGIAASEIVWKEGGKGIAGFQHIPTQFLNFKNGTVPTIITDDNSEGEEIPENKVVLHKIRRNGNDPIRGGIVRVIAWLHCFQNANTRWKMSFIERFGIPYVLLKISEKQFESELRKYQSLAANFGANGAAVVTESTSMEMVQASNTAGDVFSQLDAYIDAQIEKIIIGQNASSGQSAGLSGGDAQSAVRDDIRRADCMGIAASINAHLIRPWFAFNFGTDVALMPRFEFVVDLDDEKLKNETLKLKIDAMATAAEKQLITIDKDVEATVREIIGLPPMGAETEAAWEKLGGVRSLAPIPENASETPTPMSDFEPEIEDEYDEIDVEDIQKFLTQLETTGAIEETFGELSDEVKKILEIEDEKEFEAALETLVEVSPFGDTEKLRTVLEGVIYQGIAEGAIAAHRGGKK